MGGIAKTETGANAVEKKAIEKDLQKRRQFNRIIFKRRKILWNLIWKTQVAKNKITQEDIERAENSGGTYGHWWIVIEGENKSYGWWPHPDDKLNLFTTIKGVRGVLNSDNGDRDPHHKDDEPDEEFVMIIAEDDERSQEDLINEIIHFAKSFVSGWAYPAKNNYDNCHSFQNKTLKKCNFQQKGKLIKRDSKGNETDKSRPTPLNVEEVN